MYTVVVCFVRQFNWLCEINSVLDAFSVLNFRNTQSATCYMQTVIMCNIFLFYYHNLRKGKFQRKQGLHGENNSIGFIEAIHEWKWNKNSY